MDRRVNAHIRLMQAAIVATNNADQRCYSGVLAMHSAQKQLVEPPALNKDAISPVAGLSATAAALKLAADGPNELPGNAPTSNLLLLRQVLTEPMFLMLLVWGWDQQALLPSLLSGIALADPPRPEVPDAIARCH